MAKYIGKMEVKEYKDIDGPVPKVRVILSDNEAEEFTKEQLENVVSDTPYDDAEVRIKKWSPAVKQIMEILLKNDMMIIEKDFVTSRIDATIIENYGKAAAKLFGAKYEDFITLNQIDKALKS